MRGDDVDPSDNATFWKAPHSVQVFDWDSKPSQGPLRRCHNRRNYWMFLPAASAFWGDSFWMQRRAFPGQIGDRPEETGNMFKNILCLPVDTKHPESGKKALPMGSGAGGKRKGTLASVGRAMITALHG